MTLGAKICGLSTPETVAAALAGGAAYVGFVFFPKSPRHLRAEVAAQLAGPARGRAKVVAVVVDPSDDLVDEIAAHLRPDFLQLHGQETPGRASALKTRTGTGIIKALSVSESADLDAAQAWTGVSDHLMFDAKPPSGADLPGGVGARFDWAILNGRSFERPWFLAGGLNPRNVAKAVRQARAPLVDVSSGVETAPGLKDPRLITAFLDAVRNA
jgi:phosphoribosylanthranilate isomerase